MRFATRQRTIRDDTPLTAAQGWVAPGYLLPRHVTVTVLLAQGMGLEDVKNLLGHSSITLTSNTYGHVPGARQREVARVMDAEPGG